MAQKRCRKVDLSGIMPVMSISYRPGWKYDLNELVELENRIQSVLEKEQPGPPSKTQLTLLDQFTDLVFDLSRAGGKIEKVNTISEHLAGKPTFILGSHRSGTTFLQSLLDSHPECLVIPFETNFKGSFLPKARQLDIPKRQEFLTKVWLRRQISPINSNPNWIFGRSNVKHSPYVLWSRIFQRLIEEQPAFFNKFAPFEDLLSLVCSLVCMNEKPFITWVEKTPLNELFVPEISHSFPQGKFIHVIRDPAQILISKKAMHQKIFGFFESVEQIDQLAQSMNTALENSISLPKERYMIVTYEALVNDQKKSLEEISKFLGLKDFEFPIKTTLWGQPFLGNSSFKGSSRNTFSLNNFEIAMLDKKVGPIAGQLGYSITKRKNIPQMIITSWSILHRIYIKAIRNFRKIFPSTKFHNQ